MNEFETPVLLLGLIGFGATEEAQIRSIVAALHQAAVEWQVSEIAVSDAWLVSGSDVQVLPDDALLVRGPVEGAEWVRLVLDEVDRPIAFSDPCSPEFNPVLHFDPERPAELGEVLHQIELWLRPRISQFWLASQIFHRDRSLRGGRVYHLEKDGDLLAVIDRTGDIGLRPSATIAELHAAAWNARPASATFVPSGFVRLSFSELMWEYAVRTRQDLLPPRYRTALMYVRRPPKVPQRVVRDVHWLVLRELSAGPGTFDELQARTGLDGEPLASALGALYLAGSITTDRRRAGASFITSTAGPSELDGAPTTGPSAWPQSTGGSLEPPEFTVPAHLPARRAARKR